jgi:hypothetical protein
LLLASDPSRWIGVHGNLPYLLRMLLPVAHGLSFFVLAVLALAARWPVPRWGIVLFLMIYGGATEIIQSLVPSRMSDWLDWLQDIGGIAVGAALCWGVASLIGLLLRIRRSRHCDNSCPADGSEIVNKVMRRSAAGEQSWWG